jgi:hypothetical protein
MPCTSTLVKAFAPDLSVKFILASRLTSAILPLCYLVVNARCSPVLRFASPPPLSDVRHNRHPTFNSSGFSILPDGRARGCFDRPNEHQNHRSDHHRRCPVNHYCCRCGGLHGPHAGSGHIRRRSRSCPSGAPV